MANSIRLIKLIHLWVVYMSKSKSNKSLDWILGCTHSAKSDKQWNAYYT